MKSGLAIAISSALIVSLIVVSLIFSYTSYNSRESESQLLQTDDNDNLGDGNALSALETDGSSLHAIAASVDGKIQRKTVTVSNTTDAGNYLVSLSFVQPIIADKEKNTEMTFQIIDANTGEPARGVEYMLVVSKADSKDGGLRLIGQGQAKDGTGQIQMQFDKVGWYLVEINPANEKASFRIFSAGVDFGTDGEAYFPGQNIKVSGVTYPDDKVLITLRGPSFKDSGDNASSAQAESRPVIDNKTIIADKDGAFKDVELSWPSSDDNTQAKDGLYTVTAFSASLEMEAEKTIYFSHEKPAMDIYVEPIPSVMLAEKADESCMGPAARVLLKVKAFYSDSGKPVDNATVRLLDIYRLDDTESASHSDGSNGNKNGQGQRVTSFTISEFENKFRYSDRQQAWFGPGLSPPGAFFYTDQTPYVYGNYLLPGKYYFTVLVDDGRVKAVERSRPFELTGNVTRYVESVGKTGSIGLLKPGYNATFAGTSKYAGMDVDWPYEEGTIQYHLPMASDVTKNGRILLNATGWLRLYELESAYGGFDSVVSSPFNVNVDTSNRMMPCSNELYRIGQFFPFAIQNASSLQPGDQVAWKSAPFMNATVLGDERIKIMNATVDTVRIREDNSILRTNAYNLGDRYDPNYFEGSLTRLGDVDAWFEKSTGHLVKLSAQTVRYFSEEMGYRPVEVVSVMNSTNMPMEKTYEFPVTDKNGITRKVFVETNAIIDRFEYWGRPEENSSDGTTLAKFRVRPTMAYELYYIIKIPKAIMATPTASLQILAGGTAADDSSASSLDSKVDATSDPFYATMEVKVDNSTTLPSSNGKGTGTSIAELIVTEIEQARVDATTHNNPEEQTSTTTNYPLKPLPFFVKEASAEYYAQKLSDLLGTGKLRLLDSRSEYDGTCGYSPEDIHEVYRFTPVIGNIGGRGINAETDASTITVSLCAGQLEGITYDALDSVLLIERHGYNVTNYNYADPYSNEFQFLPVEGVKDAPVVLRPLSDYRTHLEKTREITLQYLDEVPPLECFSRERSCDSDESLLDTVPLAPYIRLSQKISLGENNAEIGRGMVFSGTGVTASFDNTRGTLLQYSITKMYDTGAISQSIKYTPADARDIMRSFWNKTLNLDLNVGGGWMREDGTVVAVVCDGRIYYHLDSYHEERTGPVNIHYFENSVDAVTGDIVTDAQFYAVSSGSCPPVDRFNNFTISAKPEKQDYAQGQDVGIILEVTNNSNKDVKYEYVVAGFVAYDSKTGKPVGGRIMSYAGGSTSDYVYRHGFFEFAAGQTTVLDNDDGTGSKGGANQMMWEDAPSGDYLVKVFVLSPFMDLAEFKITVD